MFKYSEINSKINHPITFNKKSNNLSLTYYKNKYSGFTLIELLVVIAIIGILASIVLVSLNTAREKGIEAAIKSNLKNMIPQAELSYINNYSTACAGVAKMMTSIDDSGGNSACYSYSNGTTEIYTRWGVSATLNSDSNKNWSVDNSGVVEWDTVDASSSTMNWTAATAACTASGGHLPTVDQIRSLYAIYGVTPPTFQVSSYYWSSMVDSADSNYAYLASMHSASVYDRVKTDVYWVRCVHS